MIGKLTGIIEEVLESSLLIDVGGVGYIVSCSQNTLRRISEVGEKVSLFIETLIRPEHITLYGFITPIEQEIFKALLTVQGVGGKVCLALLSALTTDEICQAIALQDSTLLTKAEGVGPKVATRIIHELKGKTFIKMTLGSGTNLSPPKNSLLQDALSALTNLGYGRNQAQEAIAHILANDKAPVGLKELIPLALKQLSAVRSS